MKKTMILAAMAAMFLFSGCADNKTFTKADGKTFTASPYGWMDSERKIDGVEYELCTGNIVLSIVFSETVAAPVLLTGLELWEPVSYTEPTSK